MADTQKLEAEFNIDLEEVGAASKAASDTEEDGKVGEQANNMIEPEEDRLISEGPEDAVLPKSYPRLL